MDCHVHVVCSKGGDELGQTEKHHSKSQGIEPTVLPEIFARVLFSLNFAVGVGPRKLSERNFLRTRKF